MEKISETFFGYWGSLSEEKKESIRESHSLMHKQGEPAKFVVVYFSKKDWNSVYSHGGYCFMGYEGESVRAGTVMLSKIFNEKSVPCKEMDDSELRQYQMWCEAANQYPRPFEIVKSII